MSTLAPLSKELFDLILEWELSPTEQINLLGIAPENPSDFVQFTENASPQKRRTLNCLISVQECVSILFPPNRVSGYLRSPNSELDGKTALEIMSEDPSKGIPRMLKYLQGSIQGGHY